MRFDRPLLAAIVETGQLTEPGAADYLVDTLLARRDKVAAAYLDGVTPLDDFAIEDGRLCATDLSRKYGAADDGVVLRIAGDESPSEAFPVADDGRVCIPLAIDDQYRILRLQIRRANHTTPTMQLHYRGGARPRVLGVVR